MEIKEFVPRPPVTEAAVFDGSADTALSEWCSGTLIPTDDPDVWTLDVPVWATTYHAQAGDVVFRSTNMGSWTPFAVMSAAEFDLAFMPKEV